MFNESMQRNMSLSEKARYGLIPLDNTEVEEIIIGYNASEALEDWGIDSWQAPEKIVSDLEGEVSPYKSALEEIESMIDNFDLEEKPTTKQYRELIEAIYKEVSSCEL